MRPPTKRQLRNLARGLRRISRQIDRDREKREQERRDFFGRCNCPRFCYFHTPIAGARP